MPALKKQKITVPSFLQPGDLIGITTPASPYKPEGFQEGLHLLKQWGFRVVLGRKGISRKGYLAGTDQERAEEFMALFTNPEIKAVLCSRGGYGAMRVLDYLDFKKIKDHPKLFMGFSDITVLLLALLGKAGLMAFHGPMVTSLSQLNPSSLIRVEATLRGHFQIKLPLDKKRAFLPGSAEGVLIGGNLTLLTHLIGTPYEPVWDGAILFLEDCGEEPYRLDRLFMHLKLRGCLKKVSALLLGQFTGSNTKEVPLRAIKKMLGDLDIPVWTGLPIGHGSRNIPLPVGAPAFLDGEKGLLSIEL
ncbi:MAG: LD-carboxypeptidase [Pseudomonadota bacterium]